MRGGRHQTAVGGVPRAPPTPRQPRRKPGSDPAHRQSPRASPTCTQPRHQVRRRHHSGGNRPLPGAPARAADRLRRPADSHQPPESSRPVRDRAAKHDLAFTVLSDPGNVFARHLGILTQLSPEERSLTTDRAVHAGRHRCAAPVTQVGGNRRQLWMTKVTVRPLPVHGSCTASEALSRWRGLIG